MRNLRNPILSILAIMVLAAPILEGVQTAQRLQAQAPTTRSPATQSLEAMEAAGIKIAFDVASVKPNKSSDRSYTNFPMGGAGWVPTGGLFSAKNISLLLFISFAYNLTSQRDLRGLPAWANTDKFDIEARAQGNPSKDQVRMMMQSLLADRFKLALHKESVAIPVYALVLSKPGKTGPQLQQDVDDGSCAAAAATANKSPAPVTPPPAPAPPLSTSVLQSRGVVCGSIFGVPASTPGRLRSVGKRFTMAMLTRQFPGGPAAGVDRPVVDRTGLSGTYDFSIEWSPAPSPLQPSGFTPDDTGPTFLEALKDQLGLKLEPQTAPEDVFVIDHLQEPSPN